MEVISIDDASSSIEVEGGAGSDVEEVIHWDRELRRTSTFVTAVMILSGRAYSSPTLADQQKVLLRFVDEPAEIYFKRNSTQASAFKNIMFDCKSGWKPGQTEAARMANIKKKWKVRFVAEQLALLLVLRRQVEKAKKEKEEIEQQRTLRSESASASAGGVPKNNTLKRAFFKRKSPPEIPTLSDNTPPDSIYLRNAGNRFHRNGLSSVPMNPHGEQAGASVAVTAAATVPTGPAKLDRVGKKVLEKFMDPTTTPGTKKIVARTHSKIANRDPAMTKMVDLFEFQCTQEVAETCIDLERNMG